MLKCIQKLPENAKFGIFSICKSSLKCFSIKRYTPLHHYPFGMLMPGRQSGIIGRYGFNGKEQDNSINRQGIDYDYGERMYDTRICSWFSVDPLFSAYPHQSPYRIMSDDPINKIDPTGLGDYYSKDGKKLGTDNKMVKQGKGKNSKLVSDDKAYMTTESVIADNTKDGVTNWDAVIGNSATTTLSVSNSTLGAYANAITRESSGDQKESYGIASAISNLAKYRQKSLLTTLKIYGVYGYNGEQDFSNKKYGLEAAINALIGGTDYSNGAIRWDGDDFGKYGLNHIKPVSFGIQITYDYFEEYKKAYSSVFNNFSKSLDTEIHTATSGENKGRCLYISVAVHGRTIFWGVNKDPVLIHYDSPPGNATYEFMQSFYPKVIGEQHVNSGYKKWTSL